MTVNVTNMNCDELNTYLRSITEESCKQFFQEEKKGKKRVSVLLRLHTRLHKFKYIKERNDIMMKYRNYTR